MDHTFSMEGRISRSTFAIRYFTAVTCLVAVGVLVVAIAAPRDGFFWGGPVLILAVGIYLFYAIKQFVRRFHDIGWPGYCVFMALIPFGGFVMIVLLLAKRGTDGPNGYGDDPLAPAAGQALADGLKTA